MENTALNSLSTYGKTFRFASLLLSRNQVEQSARLYYFCRCVDDIADDTDDKHLARQRLDKVQDQLMIGRSSEAFVEDFLKLSHQLDIPVAYASTLVKGVKGDLGAVRVQSKTELIQYAYKVAGVVGQMMCPILKADKKGMPYAIDLGIALQLTNIARDVLEDAKMGRRYLPYQWCPFSPNEIVASKHDSVRRQVSAAIEKVLQLADQYYRSARQGYCFLPQQSRRAIIVAESVYRQIGVKLRQGGLNYWQGRTEVTLLSKVKVAVSALSSISFDSPCHHDFNLHQPLVLLTDYETCKSKFDGND